jgi:hydrogenase maturation protein HypF
MRQGFPALVMTSGNVSEEPIAIDNAEAMSRLRDIADYFLLHNRDIYLRSDDSVARVDDGAPAILRRSRGYAPAPVRLSMAAPVSVLAVGAELKNTICLTKGENAFVSQHVGDPKNVAECEFFEMTIHHLKTIFQIEPTVIAHDLHPDYQSTRYALAQDGMRRIAVQHHHAHIASCLAEHGRDEKAIGLSFDGTGYGADGKIWGGEVLIADLAGFERAGHFRYVRMPGGDRAVAEPDRMALGYLYAAFGEDAARLDLDLIRRLGENRVKNLLTMIRSGLNSPETSSVGRIFDAVSALVGVCHRATYEGQPAVELEGVADPECREFYPYSIQEGSDLVIDLVPAFRDIVCDLAQQAQEVIPREVTPCARRIAAKLHNTIAEASGNVCARLRDRYGLRTVAMSGGVFQNQFLSERLTALLRRHGFDVLRHREIPPNDGGISLGQAAVALCQLTARR